MLARPRKERVSCYADEELLAAVHEEARCTGRIETQVIVSTLAAALLADPHETSS